MSIDDTTQTTEDGDYRVVSGERTCDNCIHAPVCTLLAGIRPMLQSWSAGEGPDSEPPIELLELAVICQAFEHRDD